MSDDNEIESVLNKAAAIGKVYGQNRGTLITLAGLFVARKKPSVWAVLARTAFVAASAAAFVAYQYWR
jgi:hypothetical protein